MQRTSLHYQSSTVFENRHFHIDEGCAIELLEFMENPKMKSKIDYIIKRILNTNFFYYDDYVKIENGISEMRIFPNGVNARIYCREVSTINGSHFIIAAKLLVKKKSMKINKQINQFIDPIKDYDYDL